MPLMLEREGQPPPFEAGSFEADSSLFLAKLQLSENQNMFCDYNYANYFFFSFSIFSFFCCYYEEFFNLYEAFRFITVS